MEIVHQGSPALTIKPLHCFASFIAYAVLPDAVGPKRTIIRFDVLIISPY
jgi:hypothetical protein